MLSITQSMAISGLTVYLVSVQVDVSHGLPYFEIVGLPDASVKEAKERVRIAIKNSGYDFFSKRVVINLAPANTKKGGAVFDLAIAIGILNALGIVNGEALKEYIIIGELSLDGKIKAIDGALPICIELKKQGIKNVILPVENINEVTVLEDINIYPVTSLKEVVDHFNGISIIEKAKKILYDDLMINEIYNVDFIDVYGQENVKRVLEISAAGAHNVLMMGSPGCGKTMLAQRLPTILPNLTFNEALEVTKIYSILGSRNIKNGICVSRPFRAPHYTISEKALIGGGEIPKPGEVTLANYGVLFLDEFAEFKLHTLELLRTPIEDREITISRVNSKITYPTNFILIAAMNPCPCGYYGSKIKECICSENIRKRYLQKLNGPLLDRFDLFIYVNSVKYNEINKKDGKNSSEEIRKRVENARRFQLERYKKYGIYTNSELTGDLLGNFCELDDKSRKLLKKFYEQEKISTRAYNKIIKISRTIADLDTEERIRI